MKKSKRNRCQCCNKSILGAFHLVFGDEGKRCNIAAVLFDYIKKSLNETDGVQYAICDSCWDQLIKYNAFKQKCIEANEESSDEDDEKDMETEENVEYQLSSDYGNAADGEYLYEDDEYLDESKFGSEEATIEYLDDDIDEDQFGDEFHQNEETKKVLPFDFTSVLVKAVFVLGMDNPNNLSRLKRKLSTGIPRHAIETKMNKPSNQMMDVDKIATSDDLMNILEDDYRSERTHPTKHREADSNQAEQLTDIQIVDIDDYLKSIAMITYEESYEDYISCVLCSEVIMSQQHLIYHINECHSQSHGFLCVFDENCSPSTDLVKVQEHIFQDHVDLIPTQVNLTCLTCENTFKSPVQFGKHMCLTIEDENMDFQCASCDKKLNSRKRYLFHTQFHLENARPKICIICELSFKNEESFYNHVMFSHERVFEYFCEECDKSFSSNFRLELHTRTQHTKRNIQCGLCDKRFVDKNMLDEHISSKHSARAQSEKSLECPECKKTYNRSSRLRKHMTTHEQLQKSSVLICEPCSMAFASIEDIDEHCNRLHDDENVNIGKREIFHVVCCEYCECAFTDNLKLVEHKQSHSNDEKPFKCGFCMACYETYSKLKTHKNTHINLQVKFPVQRHYMCDVDECWKRYRHWSDLLNHRKTVHLINPSIYKCNDCEQTFYQSWNFSYHKKTVHSITKIKCPMCEFECKSVYNLKTHQKKCHPINTNESAEPPEKPKPKPKIETPLTKKAIDIDQYLRKTERAMVCNICDKELATRNSARSHIEMIHLKIKKFACEECGKEYYLKKDLNDHKRLHTAETPYECTICYKKFRTSSMLNDHRKSHSNNRPHRCHICTSTFKRAYVLKNHIKQHTGVKGYPCSIENCPKEYRTQWELNSHQRLKHSNESTDQIAYEPDIMASEYVNSHPDNTQFQSDEQKMFSDLNIVSGLSKRTNPPAKKKIKKSNQQIIYLMSGPSTENSMDKSLVRKEEYLETQSIFSSEDDHTYPVPDNSANTNLNVMHVIEGPLSSNSQMNTDQSNFNPTRILVCNPKFKNFTIMDIGAVQTIDQNI